MDQKEVRAIADLIKHYGKLIPEQFVLGLADHFEKEEGKHKGNQMGFHTCKKCGSKERCICICHSWCIDCQFNPKQFLGWCGVE